MIQQNDLSARATRTVWSFVPIWSLYTFVESVRTGGREVKRKGPERAAVTGGCGFMSGVPVARFAPQVASQPRRLAARAILPV